MVDAEDAGAGADAFQVDPPTGAAGAGMEAKGELRPRRCQGRPGNPPNVPMNSMQSCRQLHKLCFRRLLIKTLQEVFSDMGLDADVCVYTE